MPVPSGEMSARPCVALCAGKDCRRAEGYRELRSELGADADVSVVRCLEVCVGPVVVVELSKPIVLRKLRTRKQRRDLVAVLNGAALSDRLDRRRVRGKSRRVALGELAKHTRRKPDRS